MAGSVLQETARTHSTQQFLTIGPAFATARRALNRPPVSPKSPHASFFSAFLPLPAAAGPQVWHCLHRPHVPCRARGGAGVGRPHRQALRHAAAAPCQPGEQPWHGAGRDRAGQYTQHIHRAAQHRFSAAQPTAPGCPPAPYLPTWLLSSPLTQSPIHILSHTHPPPHTILTPRHPRLATCPPCAHPPCRCCTMAWGALRV
jgi:hypothetical protein